MYDRRDFGANYCLHPQNEDYAENGSRNRQLGFAGFDREELNRAWKSLMGQECSGHETQKSTERFGR
jgi:hypothetical protein